MFTISLTATLRGEFLRVCARGLQALDHEGSSVNRDLRGCKQTRAHLRSQLRKNMVLAMALASPKQALLS